MYGRSIAPAYRITTERLVLRCWDPADAPALKRAIDASLEHLLPWMPWAREEPQSVEMKMELLRKFRGRFDLDKDHVYGIFTRDESAVVGGAGLHKKPERHGSSAREIGYWIAQSFTGQGLATEAAAALVRVAFEVEHVERLDLCCEPENVRSAAIARKLGFHEDGLLRQRMKRSDGTLGPQQVFSLLAAEYEESAAAQARIEAFDALGRKSLELPVARRKSAFRG